MKRIFLNITILTAVLILQGCKSANSPKEIESGPENVLVLSSGPGNPRNSEGDFITLRDGRIMYVYSHYTGESANDHASAVLAARFSSDNGKSWTDHDTVIVEQEGRMNVMSVSLLRLQNGEIALFYLRKNSETDCIPMLRLSDDETGSWSGPVPCITDQQGYFVLNNDRVIQLKSGRLLFAVARHAVPGGRTNETGRIWSYFSDDNGRTWKSGSEVANPGSIVTQEPGLIELNNGEVLMFMRTMSNVQYFSTSRDKGETWTAVAPWNLKSPCSPASVARIPGTGDLVVAWNDNGTDQKRTPYNIAISKDEGKTWINNKVLENNPGGSYCYTAIQFTDDEILLGYFDWSTTGSTVKKIPVRWLYR